MGTAAGGLRCDARRRCGAAPGKRDIADTPAWVSAGIDPGNMASGVTPLLLQLHDRPQHFRGSPNVRAWTGSPPVQANCFTSLV